MSKKLRLVEIQLRQQLYVFSRAFLSGVDRQIGYKRFPTIYDVHTLLLLT